MVTSFFDATYQMKEVAYASISYLTYVLSKMEDKTIDLSYNRDMVYGYILDIDKIIEKQIAKISLDNNNDVKISFTDNVDDYYCLVSLDVELIQTTYNIMKSLADYPIE